MSDHQRMQEIPETERPAEKCAQFGAGVLSDCELLAVILRCGSRNENVLRLSQRILYSSGREGLLGLLYMTLQELIEIPGVGKVKAVQIQCIAELARRIARSRATGTLSFHDPVSIAEYYMEDLRHEQQEKVLLLMLDVKGKLLAQKVISVGTVNASLVSPREVFLEALAHRAVSIVLLHNHPSGDPTPSPEDLFLTEKIAKGGEMLDIALLDHIIIGDGRAVSLREQKSVIL